MTQLEFPFMYELEVCNTCKGAGFAGYGSGYGDVCVNCTGGYTGPRYGFPIGGLRFNDEGNTPDL